MLYITCFTNHQQNSTPLFHYYFFFFINLYNFNMCAAHEKKRQTINCKAMWDSLKLTQKT